MGNSFIDGVNQRLVNCTTAIESIVSKYKHLIRWILIGATVVWSLLLVLFWDEFVQYSQRFPVFEVEQFVATEGRPDMSRLFLANLSCTTRRCVVFSGGQLTRLLNTKGYTNVSFLKIQSHTDVSMVPVPQLLNKFDLDTFGVKTFIIGTRGAFPTSGDCYREQVSVLMKKKGFDCGLVFRDKYVFSTSWDEAPHELLIACTKRELTSNATALCGSSTLTGSDMISVAREDARLLRKSHPSNKPRLNVRPQPKDMVKTVNTATVATSRDIVYVVTIKEKRFSRFKSEWQRSCTTTDGDSQMIHFIPCFNVADRRMGYGEFRHSRVRVVQFWCCIALHGYYLWTGLSEAIVRCLDDAKSRILASQLTASPVTDDFFCFWSFYDRSNTTNQRRQFFVDCCCFIDSDGDVHARWRPHHGVRGQILLSGVRTSSQVKIRMGMRLLLWFAIV